MLIRHIGRRAASAAGAAARRAQVQQHQAPLLLLGREAPGPALALHARSFGFFSQLKDELNKELENNEEMKKALDELKGGKKEGGEGGEKEGGEGQGEGEPKAAAGAESGAAGGGAAEQEGAQTAAGGGEEEEDFEARRKKVAEEASARADRMAEEASAAAEKVKASAEKFAEENPELGEKYRAGKETFERGFEGAKESFKGAADAADKRLEGDEKTSGFWAEVKLAAKELFAPAEPPSVNKKLYGEAPARPEGEGGAEEDGGIPNESGTTALVFVAAEAGTWQKLTQRLRETPIIQGILGAAAEAAETETGQKLNQRAKAASKIVGDKHEEASEFWETSQNPWVYRASSIYDGVFGETETGAAIRELRRADPTFELSEWTEGVTQTVLPDVLDWYLRGDAVKLKTWCNDRTQAMMGAVIKERKAAGLVADPSVLDIEGVTVVDAKCQDKQPPIIIVQFAAQQIHCIRNREGEIVDGADDLIEQHYYMFVFQREITKQDELAWRVVEFAPLFKQPYI